MQALSSNSHMYTKIMIDFKISVLKEINKEKKTTVNKTNHNNIQTKKIPPTFVHLILCIEYTQTV